MIPDLFEFSDGLPAENLDGQGRPARALAAGTQTTAAAADSDR